jgi:anti-anti-sigma factor
LTLSVRDDGVIALEGEVDGATADGLDDALVVAGPVIQLDLAGVSFIDSAGLHTLLRAHHRPGAAVSIVAASANVLRLFELAGVDDVLLPESHARRRIDGCRR